MDENTVAKLMELHQRLKEIKAEKKAMNADFKDRIKDIQGEIDEIVEKYRQDNK